MAFGLIKHSGGGEGGGKMGGFGHRALELGGMAAIALASKNMPGGLFGIEPLKPDLVGIALSLIGVVALKNKKGGRTARALLFASLNATIARWVYSPAPFFASTSGHDIPSRPARPPAPPPTVNVNVGASPTAKTGNRKTVTASAT